MSENLQTPERESMEYDIVIVGAGPAGLSAAIRAKQIDADLNVVVLEKGSEVGAHILSGAVLDPIGLEKLFPNFAELGAPVKTKVTADKLAIFGPAGAVNLPTFLMPPLMHNHGNYIVSMGNVCRWLAEQAEGLGVEVFPGMACSELVYREDGSVKGVVAGEFGRSKDGGMGEALKEIWDIKPENHNEGEVYHSAGWPLGMKQGGGSFLYHAENNQLFLGMIVDLNYSNPNLYPYAEFQRWKHHPQIAKLLEGGKRVAYGARVVTKGGYQSIPRVAFPGGALLGCTAGLVNLPRIKGNHNAMLSGIHAAEAAAAAIKAGRAGDDLQAYDDALHDGPIGEDLRPVRNVAPLNSRFGPFLGGMLLGGLDMWAATIAKINIFGTLSHKKNDAKSTGLLSDHKEIDYPKPDGVISFDRLTNVSFTATNHSEEQPSHLKLADDALPISVNLPNYAEPAQRYCPAGVYEILRDDDGSNPRFNVNSQNCIHCKTCDIKDPSENITWTVPEGGGGPNYPNM